MDRLPTTSPEQPGVLVNVPSCLVAVPRAGSCLATQLICGRLAGGIRIAGWVAQLVVAQVAVAEAVYLVANSQTSASIADVAVGGALGRGVLNSRVHQPAADATSSALVEHMYHLRGFATERARRGKAIRIHLSHGWNEHIALCGAT